MPVFWFLVCLGLVLLWFILAFAYKAIGRFFLRLYKDSYDAIMEKDYLERKTKEHEKR